MELALPEISTKFNLQYGCHPREPTIERLMSLLVADQDFPEFFELFRSAVDDMDSIPRDLQRSQIALQVGRA
jgi:hypothetical protein